MSRKEDRRLDHKTERAAVRQVLDGGHVRQPHSGNWGYRPEPIVLPDEAFVSDKKKHSKGCKRNKYGPHIIERWFISPSRPWYLQHPPYRCQKCGKGFYSIPKRNAIWAASGTRVFNYNLENEIRGSHYDLYNIRCRLLDLPCQCKDCQESI